MTNSSDEPGPLARRLAAAGLGTLAEEEQSRLDSAIQELVHDGHPDEAEAMRERLART